ncbi:MAG: chromosomal replication initiator protein DnaA [Proteobacteria bacterium]|nr:chromosomal replication initiator protein DnaA [Pseudomonadota bacterium]
MLWEKCLNRLKSDIDEQVINIWLKPLQVSQSSSSITIIAPNKIIVDKIRTDFLDIINLAIKDISDQEIKVTISLPKLVNADITDNSADYKEMPTKPSNVDKRFTFDNFVVGNSNSIAKAAALQVAQESNTQFNPLIIYGSTGLGKTHLLHAIGNKILENDPSAVVSYVHSEQFVNNMIFALSNHSISEFKKHYRSVNALLIDDIQFFAGKNRSQEEFFHTFNALLEGNQRVIITSDRFPKKVNGLEPRLKSRIGGGLSVPIDPPEFETRVAILKEKATQQGFVLDDAVAFMLAEKIQSNVRELEGALNTLRAKSLFKHADITLDFAKYELKELFNVHSQLVSIETIQKQVATYYNIRVSDLLSKKRTRSLVRPRQMAMYLAKELTDKSLPEIGEAFGGKDHTTVLYAHKKVLSLFDEQPEYLEDKQKLIIILTS